MKPRNPIYNFFTNEVEITPTSIEFEKQEILTARKALFNITNKHDLLDITLKAILTSSPEVSIFFPDGI